jgi:YfiH family protein
MSEVTGNRQVVMQTQNGLTCYRLSSLPVWHGFFARTGGLSREPYATLNTAYVTQDPHAAENRERLLTTLGIADAPIRVLNPCHGEKLVFMEKRDWQTGSHAVLSKTDAAFTDTPDRYFLVSTGDCIPAVFTDVAASFAGVVHLGWRNLVADLTGTVITALQSRYEVAPGSLVVGIGPAIYPCCYVFQEPMQKDDPFWQPFLQDRENGHYGIDLIAAFKAQLLQRGVQEANIHETGLCTSCHNELFFSCYKEGYVSGRFPTVVGLARR